MSNTYTNKIPAPLIMVCLITATVLLAGCGSSDNEIGPAEKGTTFSDVSSLISSYARGPKEGSFDPDPGYMDGYGGIAWLDFDVDGDLDLLLNNEPGFDSALFRNDDGIFTDVTLAANALVTTGNSGIVVGDIDNDGCPDIFMSGTGFFAGVSQSPTVMLHNLCNGKFEDISGTANVPGAETALSAAMADINNDGYVDLFVTAQGHLGLGNPIPKAQHKDKLYLNNGDLTFTDISDTAFAPGTNGFGSCVASFSHFDDDEFIDLFVAVCNDVNLSTTPWHVYRNNGDSTFTDVASTTQLDKGGLWMSSAFGDIDNDGDFDIFATNLGGQLTHHLWRNNGDGTYVNIAPDNGDTQDFWAWGATFADWDNDNFQDLYYVGELPGSFGIGRGNRGFMFFNNGNSRFTVNNEAHGLDLRGKGVTGLAKADYDGDGFVDFVIMTSHVRKLVDGVPTNPVAAAILMRNNGNSNNSISIQLEGTVSNRMAIGARIEIIDNAGVFQAREIWAGSSFASNESPWPVFGLGQATRADVLVYWPCGLVEGFSGLSANVRHTLAEGTGAENQNDLYCEPN